MNAQFVSSVWGEPHDATGWHSALPRPIRKTLRVPNKSPKPCLAQTDLTETLRNLRPFAEFLQNNMLIDPEYGDDEFQDIDDEFAGLTITEPMTEVELFEFCTGYNII